MKIILAIFFANFSLQFYQLTNQEFTNLRTDVIESLRANPFQNNNRIVVDNSGNTHLISERRLNLYDINAFEKEVSSLVISHGWVLDRDSKQNLLVSIKDIKTGKKDYIFRAKIETTDVKGIASRISYIVLDNKPSKDDSGIFEKYRNHHAYHRRAIGTVESSENTSKRTLFIKNTIQNFKDIADKVKSPATVSQLYDLIVQTLSAIEKTDMVISEKFKLETAIGFDLKKKNKDDLIFQVILYSVGKKYFGVDFTLEHNSHILIIPKDNINSAKENIEAILNLPEIEPEKKPLELRSLPLLVKGFIAPLCEHDAPIVNSKSSGNSVVRLTFDRSNGSVPDKLEDVCPFTETGMTILQYNYGYMQYFHLFYESKYLQQEAVLFAAKADTEAGLQKSLKLLSETMSYVQNAQAESTSEITITADEIKGVLKETFDGEDPADEPLNDAEKKQIAAAKATNPQKWKFSKSNIEVLLSIINAEFFIQLKKVGEGSHIVSGEITLPVINGYDQKKSLAMHLKEFLEKTKSQTQA